MHANVYVYVGKNLQGPSYSQICINIVAKVIMDLFGFLSLFQMAF